MAAKMSAYEYYDSLDNMTELAKYDGNARRGTINNPWVIRDWEDLQNTYKDSESNVYNSSYQAHFILVNDIDFAKLNFGSINTHAGDGYIGSNYRGYIAHCDSFDFNGYEFRNIIYRNITSINGFYTDALIEINYRHEDKDIIMKNVKMSNIIINECYLNADLDVSGGIYSYQRDCLSIIRFYTYRYNVVIDGLNLNISISQQNQINKTLVYGMHTTDLIYANKLQLFSIGSVYGGNIKFKNTFIKFSGINKHWFSVGSSGYRDNTDVNAICCLPSGCLHGMATMPSAKSEDENNKFKNMYDTTLFFNDYIIDVDTDGYSSSFSKCSTLLTPAIPTDSLYITGSIKIKFSKSGGQGNRGADLYICGNPHSNVIFDCELSYISDNIANNFKIKNDARYGKVIVNKDKIDNNMLAYNFDNSNGGIIFATTAQLQDETWLRNNGLFFLKTSS